MASPIPASIPTIGPGTLAILRSRGIHTNLDVLYESFPHSKREAESLVSIPGLGPARVALLREWASGVKLSQEEMKHLNIWDEICDEEEKERQKQRVEGQRQEEAARDRKRKILAVTLLGACLYLFFSWLGS